MFSLRHANSPRGKLIVDSADNDDDSVESETHGAIRPRLAPFFHNEKGAPTADRRGAKD